MQTRSCDEISVPPSACPSVRPSVKRVHCDKTEEKSVQIFIPREKIIQSSFMRRRMAGGGATPSIWNFGSTGTRWSEIADFEPIIARRASSIRPSEKSSINTNRKSPTRFPTSLRWSPYVAPKSPKGGLKTPKGRFSSIIELRLKKVCYKVSMCENCQRESCRAFIGLTIHAKIIGGGRHILLEILGQTDRIGAKSPIFDLFSFVEPQPFDVAKKVQLTLSGSPLRAFQWAQDGHRTLSLSPQRVAQ